MRIIVPLSGGKSSAYCAKWAFDNFNKKDIILYFNDTKWEHPDLYRFLRCLSNYFNHPILGDSDGRNPEQVFYDVKYLGNSKNGNCSVELKAKMMQKFYQDGDKIIFGIGTHEKRRAAKLQVRYEKVSRELNKKCELIFPLINEEIDNKKIDEWLKSTGILQPKIYDLGFMHNNCYGGCVKAGKKQWKMLWEKLPEVFLERERMEEEWQSKIGKNYTILKDISLKQFRLNLSSQLKLINFEDEENYATRDECLGICDLYN